MAYAREHDLLFCDLCGTMLSLTSTKYAHCPLCKFKRSAKEISGYEICYTVSDEDIRRELGISLIDEGKLEGATINKKCLFCENTVLKFQAMQMRSADEGQTVTYTCEKCNQSFTEN